MKTEKKHSWESLIPLSLFPAFNPKSVTCTVAVSNGDLGNIHILPGRNGLILRNITDQCLGNWILSSKTDLNPYDTEIFNFLEGFLVFLAGLKNQFSCWIILWKRANSVKRKTLKHTVKLLPIMIEIRSTLRLLSLPPLLHH